MFLESMVSLIFLVFIFGTNYLHASPVNIDIYENLTNTPLVVDRKVLLGDTVTLKCRSNDQQHNFLYWHVIDNNMVVGPLNTDYDLSKYRYEVLSGNLTVRRVSYREEGLYNCVSRGVLTNNIKIRSVRMIITDEDGEDINGSDADANNFKIIVVLCTLVILGCVGYVVYKIWKDRFRHPAYLVPSEDEDEDDSAEEIFRAPGTSKQTEIQETSDNAGIDTDFKSILDRRNSK